MRGLTSGTVGLILEIIYPIICWIFLQPPSRNAPGKGDRPARRGMRESMPKGVFLVYFIII